MPTAQQQIELTRDDLITIAKGMARDPSTDDTKSRFPLQRYKDWVKESYIYHLSTLPIPLLRNARHLAQFTFPANISHCYLFQDPYFTNCSTDNPDYACDVINRDWRFCLRITDVSWGGSDCDLISSAQEYKRGEESAYERGTRIRPRALLDSYILAVSPYYTTPMSGFLHWVGRPSITNDNYGVLLEVEVANLVAKYVACRRFGTDGEGQQYQMLYREYQEELNNLTKIYSQAKEQK